ncbi:unnamed protein product [Urochloa humidicola]
MTAAALGIPRAPTTAAALGNWDSPRPDDRQRPWESPRVDNLRGLPPPPPRRHPLPSPRRPPTPRPRGGDGARGGDTRLRGGAVPEREVAAPGAAAASGGNAAGDAPPGVAASVVAREGASGGGGGVGSKRSLPPASAPPPSPKRRAGSASATRRFPPGCGRHASAPLADPRSGDAGARGRFGVFQKVRAPPPPLSGGKDGALFGAVTPRATGTSALKVVSAAGANAPVANCRRHGPEAGLVNSSSQAWSDMAAPDGSLGIGSQGVPAVSVEGREDGTRSAEFGRKEMVLAAALQPQPMMSVPPGCGKDAVLSVLLGEGIGEARLPLESRLADGDLGVAEEAVSADVRSMVVLPPQRNETTDGTLQDDELEEGEIAPEVVVQESQVPTSETVQNSSACRHGASADISAAETSAMQSSDEKTGRNTLLCGEKRSPCLVAKEVAVVNIGSSCNGVAQSLSEDSSKQNLMCKGMSESARMNRASYDVAAGDGTKIRSLTMHGSTADIQGASIPGFSATEACVMQPSIEMIGGKALQCEENRASWLVAKDVKLMNHPIGSSSNIVAESLAEDSSKQDMMGKRVSESASINIASSSVAAAGESGDSTKFTRKAMYTPRKVVRTIKIVHEETEHGGV